MKLNVNMISQLLATALQFSNAILDFMPPEGKVAVAVGITIIQGTIAVLAHFKNPDGTSASTPYDPVHPPK